MRNTTHIHAKTLSPVHIGSGRELMGNFEYLYFKKDKRVALIDDSKIFEIIGSDDLRTWISIIDRDDSLLDYLENRKPDLSAKNVAKRIMIVPDLGPDGQFQLKEQLCTPHQHPFIPGSSIKGAIITAIFTHFLLEKPNLAKEKSNLGREHRGTFKFKDDSLRKEILGENPNKDLGRLIRPSDARFGHTIVFKTQTLNKQHNGWTFDDKISPWVETIPPEKETVFRISRPGPLIEFLKANARRSPFPRNSSDFSEDRLFEIIHSHTMRHIKKELAFWNGEGNPALAGNLVNFLEELEEKGQQMQPGKECLIRIGFGGGMQSLTGDWQKDLMSAKDFGEWLNTFPRNAPHLAFPKTRKLDPNGLPFGFLHLEIIDSAKAKSITQELKLKWDKEKENLEVTTEPEKVVPQYPPSNMRIKPGVEVDAYVFSDHMGSRKRLQLYLGEGKDHEVFLTGYRADTILGQIVIVKIEKMKDDKVTQISFVRVKKENR